MLVLSCDGSIFSVDQGNRYPRPYEGLTLGQLAKQTFRSGYAHTASSLIHALMISAFIRRELQLSFYANETTCPVHGTPCREGEHGKDSDRSRRKLRLILFLSGNTDHLVDFCHAPAYFSFPLTIINTFSVHRKAVDYLYIKRFAML